MINKSLTELLNNPDNIKFIEVKLTQGNLETTLKLDKDEATISVDGITLHYSRQRLKDNLEEYAAEQLKAHIDYHELTKGALSQKYAELQHELQRKINSEMTIEHSVKSFPDSIARNIMGVAKFVLNPLIFLSSFKTLKGSMQMTVEKSKKTEYCYTLLSSAVQLGNEYIKAVLGQTNSNLSSDVSANLEKLSDIQTNILRSYSRVINTAQNIVREDQRMYNLFYPTTGAK